MFLKVPLMLQWLGRCTEDMFGPLSLKCSHFSSLAILMSICDRLKVWKQPCLTFFIFSDPRAFDLKAFPRFTFFFLVIFWVCVSGEGGFSLCSPSWSGTHYVVQLLPFLLWSVCLCLLGAGTNDVCTPHLTQFAFKKWINLGAFSLLTFPSLCLI